MDSGYLERRIWYPVHEELGLMGFRLHDFRHNLQTQGHIAGTVRVKVPAAYFGHRTEALTLGT